jgi:hypothetical protein
VRVWIVVNRNLEAVNKMAELDAGLWNMGNRLRCATSLLFSLGGEVISSLFLSCVGRL